jgi:hypothetical protein
MYLLSLNFKEEQIDDKYMQKKSKGGGIFNAFKKKR